MNGEVFLVDDNPNNLTLLGGILRAQGYRIRMADSGRRALEMIRARRPELILLDIMMPDMNGYEVCRELKADPATCDIPILFVSALEDPVDKVKAFSVGGVDYIPKPFQADEVIARVQTHLKISRLQKELFDRSTRLQQALYEVEELSLTDPLTGMKNRRFLAQNIDADVALTLRRYECLTPDSGELPINADLIFFLIDIDHFKQINDQYGHPSGDTVLAQMRKCLQQAFRTSDYMIRWGGEEFLVVAREISRIHVEAIAERVRSRVADERFVLDDGTHLRMTCSVGFACFPFFVAHPSALNWEDVVNMADNGLYAAKRSGRDGWVGLAPNVQAVDEGLMQRLKSEPGNAVRRGELTFSSCLDHDRVIEALSYL
jgi:diguanylate cyclase (GGDEF)-like protein